MVKKVKNNLFILTSFLVWFTVETLEMEVCVFSQVQAIGQKETASSCSGEDFDCIVVKISSPKGCLIIVTGFTGKVLSHCPQRYLKDTDVAIRNMVLWRT